MNKYPHPDDPYERGKWDYDMGDRYGWRSPYERNSEAAAAWRAGWEVRRDAAMHESLRRACGFTPRDCFERSEAYRMGESVEWEVNRAYDLLRSLAARIALPVIEAVVLPPDRKP